MIPLTDTIFTWQAIAATLIVYVVGVGMAWFIAPGGDNSRTAEHLGIELRPLIGHGSAYNGQREEARDAQAGVLLQFLCTAASSA